MKQCSLCKRLLPLDRFCFRDRGHKHPRTDCKACCAKRGRALHEKWKKDKGYKKRQKINCKRWQNRHRGFVRASALERYYRRGKEARLDYLKAQYQKHKDKRCAYAKMMHPKNKKRLMAYCLKWYHQHKSDPVFHLIITQRSRVRRALKCKNIPKTSSTLTLLGCTAVQLKDHLAKKFTAGMTWENHGQFGWHVDHIKPLASFDFRVEAQIMAAFHYTNLQPLWWYENLKKSDKVAVA